MGFRLSFAILNVFIRLMKSFSPTKNSLYSINLFCIIYLLKKLFFLQKTALKQLDHIWRHSTRIKKANTPYFYLGKCIKWSLKYHLSIFQYEVTHEMPPKSRKVKSSIENNHLIYLNNHLSDFIKWKYEVRAF